MKKVMVGTPCYDGRLDVWYTNSLMNTIKLGIKRDIEIIPIWISFDALIQRARNDTIQLALQQEFDDLIWIDSDIEWEPEWFFKLLDYPVDIVGGTYPKKADREEYVLRIAKKNTVDPATGLMEVDGLGTGFARMSRKSLQYLWDNSPSYMDPKDNKERRMICDVQVIDQSMYSEDIIMFLKLQQGGFKIWMDPNMTCNHIGPKKFTGNFAKYYGKNNTPRKQL